MRLCKECKWFKPQTVGEGPMVWGGEYDGCDSPNNGRVERVHGKVVDRITPQVMREEWDSAEFTRRGMYQPEYKSENGGRWATLNGRLRSVCGALGHWWEQK
jgi:hypothetical protein